MNIRKQLFKIFQENKDEYDLYEKVIAFIDKTIVDIKGEENKNFYGVLLHLDTSINNAGCENRRTEQIRYISEEMHNISSQYEKYLP